MKKLNFQYIHGNSALHRLDARTKLALLIIWYISVILFVDMRVLLIFFIGGLSLFLLSGIPFGRIRFMMGFLISFVVMMGILTNLFTPSYAGKYVEIQHQLVTIAGRTLTKETAFYSLTLMVKYLAVFPMAILFILTTNPSRLSSSLNGMGITYKITYALNIALRYLPDVQRDFNHISYAQQARGLNLQGGGPRFGRKVRALLAILFPLLLSSLDRVETVTNAMELRGFGSRRKRTWYRATTFTSLDYLFLGLSALLLAGSIMLKMWVLPGFWYPF
ncbi:energy-coupling factor transporter transmembrane component T family protein [Paenibacillus solisilvae]|uniref:Energy-coupling factor transporter transmembrane component T family protein n=1 Tax=Paenibacillus solisilvae TaxID=2486751 RepID=A0ABW0W0Y0_9BACL